MTVSRTIWFPRQVAETALHAEQLARYAADHELEQMHEEIDALTQLADAGLQDKPEVRATTADGRPLTAATYLPVSTLTSI